MYYVFNDPMDLPLNNKSRRGYFTSYVSNIPNVRRSGVGSRTAASIA